MISDLDIWRSAQAMVEHYGDGAATEAAMRADEFLDQGNIGGKRVWLRIVRTIEELQRERPKEGEACTLTDRPGTPLPGVERRRYCRSVVRRLGRLGQRDAVALCKNNHLSLT